MKKLKTITAAIATASMLAGCNGTLGVTSKRIPKGYEEKCGECREEIQNDYKYCKHCGTKVGEGTFKPYENINADVYGAPRDYELECEDCNYTEKEKTMGNIPDYCPYCGAEAEVKVSYDK